MLIGLIQSHWNCIEIRGSNGRGVYDVGRLYAKAVHIQLLLSEYVYEAPP